MVFKSARHVAGIPIHDGAPRTQKLAQKSKGAEIFSSIRGSGQRAPRNLWCIVKCERLKWETRIEAKACVLPSTVKSEQATS